MTTNLDQNLDRWLSAINRVNPKAIDREINNRSTPYTTLREILIAEGPIDTKAFFAEVIKTTPMTYLNKYSNTPVKEFFEDEPLSRHMITRLVRKLPRSDAAAITIDATIEETVQKSSLEKYHAALLFSLVLTTAHPHRFVDYPAHTHWEAFAKRLGYGIPYETSHGSRFIWAGELARTVAETDTFQKHWPSDRPPYQSPLWIVASLNWANKELEQSM